MALGERVRKGGATTTMAFDAGAHGVTELSAARQDASAVPRRWGSKSTAIYFFAFDES